MQGAVLLRTLIALGVLAAQPTRAALIELRFPSVKEPLVESSYRREEPIVPSNAETTIAPPDSGPDSATAASIDPAFEGSAFDDGRSDVCSEDDDTPVGILFADVDVIPLDRARGAGEEPVRFEPPAEPPRGYYLLFDSAQSLSGNSPERLEIDVSAQPIPAPPSSVLALIGGVLVVLAAGGGLQPSSTRPAPPRRLAPPIVCRRAFKPH